MSDKESFLNYEKIFDTLNQESEGEALLFDSDEEAMQGARDYFELEQNDELDVIHDGEDFKCYSKKVKWKNQYDEGTTIKAFCYKKKDEVLV